MTQGVQYNRYHKKALAVGSADFSTIYRGNIHDSKKEKLPTGTQGIHSTQLDHLKALDLNPIHVVKPDALTNCKPHQRSDRSRFRR